MVLQLENVVKYYGAQSVLVKAIDGISFSVDKGEFVAVMGASGSGKTTLLNLIATIDDVSGGSIAIEGRQVSMLDDREKAAFRRDKLGFVFQDYNLLDALTVEENIALPLNLRRTSPSVTRSEVERTARTLGLYHSLSKFPCELSGGEKQRVACARAMVTMPAIILADEPTGALDSRSARLLLETLTYMNTIGSTILIVTHDPVVASYAKRILFLKDGRIFDEILKGDKDRRDFFTDITDVTASLGGERDVR